jgi:hypothetical protein
MRSTCCSERNGSKLSTETQDANGEIMVDVLIADERSSMGFVIFVNF